MDNEIIKHLIIDPNLDAYQKFFDHKWAEVISEKVQNTALKHAVEEILVAWRSTHGAHILPWLMVECLASSSRGQARGNQCFRDTHVNRIIIGLVEKIKVKMQDSLNSVQLQQLTQAVYEIEKEAHETFMTVQQQNRMDASSYWASIILEPEFRFCILGTQRLNYGSLYFAYEDFLANVVRTRKPGFFPKRSQEIEKGFRDHFGDTLTNECWKHDEVELARLVRNDLVHNGGQFGQNLEKYKTKGRFVDVTGTDRPLLRGEQFNLVNDEIQITPGNTRTTAFSFF